MQAIYLGLPQLIAKAVSQSLMSNQDTSVQVCDAVERGNWAIARSLLESPVRESEPNARVSLGTVLSWSPHLDWYREGVSLLRELAEGGHGLAAHNIVTTVTSSVGATDESRSKCARYLQLATMPIRKRASRSSPWGLLKPSR